MISLIAACDENRVIGNGDDIPWHIPEDFNHFKRTTLGFPIVMGRKTWESLPKKPLPNRINIIVSRTASDIDGAYVFPTISEALTYADKTANQVFVIGGQMIYEETIEIADRLIISHVKGVHEGDKFFPEINLDQWEAVSKDSHEDFDIVVYNRKRA